MTAQPKHLLVVIPELPADASIGTHHPISRSKTPERYRPGDLADSGVGRTRWVGFFEEVLVGLYWKLGGPVPYVFKTADGTVRSLDAGCLKWLWNRKPPDVSFVLGSAGIIEFVKPSIDLEARYADRKSELISFVSYKSRSGGET